MLCSHDMLIKMKKSITKNQKAKFIAGLKFEPFLILNNFELVWVPQKPGLNQIDVGQK